MRIIRGKGFQDLFKKITDPLTEQFEQGKRTFNALAFGLTDFNAHNRLPLLAQYWRKSLHTNITRN